MKVWISTEFEQDLLFWKQNDRKIVEKIQKLLQAIIKDPFKGIGKPEQLKYRLAGC